MTFLADHQIEAYCNNNPPLIEPFSPELISRIKGRKVISYGLSSHGYDLTLSKGIKIFRHIPGTIINPKDFNPSNLVDAEIHENIYGLFSVIPGLSYGLGVVQEKINMPRNLSANIFGKSTYARIGLIVNATPVEAGWSGHLTLEFSNSSPADIMVYLNEGIAQIQFSACDPCQITYGDRNGKYQDQPQQIVTAKV